MKLYKQSVIILIVILYCGVQNMDKLLSRIAQANDMEIGDILAAVLRRYEELFPEWEVSTFSLKKETDRNRQIDETIRMLLRLKSLPE